MELCGAEHPRTPRKLCWDQRGRAGAAVWHGAGGAVCIKHSSPSQPASRNSGLGWCVFMQNLLGKTRVVKRDLVAFQQRQRGNVWLGRETPLARLGPGLHRELKGWESCFCLSKTFSSKSYLPKSISQGAESCKYELMFGVLQHLFNLHCSGLAFRSSGWLLEFSLEFISKRFLGKI